MSHMIEHFIFAKNYANAKTLERFGFHGPYSVGSEAHKYWLLHFDIAMKGL